MSVDPAMLQGESGVLGGNGSGLSLQDFSKLADANFAQEWKLRYQMQRVQMIPEVARWMRLLKYFHPRKIEDHWQDQFGMPLPKLADSEGLSITTYNMIRPIIEVYGSLLAGQKPLPFSLDVRAIDAKLRSEVFRADAQEKLFKMELENMAVPLHFLDFCVSVQLFGIGYVWAWIDDETRRLNTQAVSWPGDVLPQWGSNRYGRGGAGLESVIMVERMPVDTAQRLYPHVHFKASHTEIEIRPDGFTQMLLPHGTTQILKIWWRGEGEKIGYGEIAYDGTTSGEPETLKRDDDTEYPDIPVRWASRFQTPGEAPHRGAGCVDDVIGVNTEYSERLSAFSDLLMKFVFPKMLGKGFSITNLPTLGRNDNIIPATATQDLHLIQEIVQGGQLYFDSFLGRLETFMLQSAGLSRLMLGAVPPGETSGEALNNLLHSSIARLEVVRTPIQWAWLSLFQEVMVPLMYRFGAYDLTDPLTKRRKHVDLKELFDRFGGFEWVWPDVTPRDALKAIQTAIDLRNAGLLSDETTMERARIGSVVDELDKIRQNKMDEVLHPNEVRLSEMAKQARSASSGQGQSGGQVKVAISGQVGPDVAFELAKLVDPALASVMSAPSSTVTTGPGKGPGTAQPDASVENDVLKMQAAQAPTRSEADNTGMTARQGSPQNAAQGARGAM